jgi:two-component system phosphate regulon sensor histidine kinase PhoR
MNKSLKNYIAWATLIMLGILLFLQIRWIDYSVRFQEKVFKNSVDLALNKTIANLNNDQMVCSAMRECMGCGEVKSDSMMLTPGVWEQIRASIDSELAVYQIETAYDLFITRHSQDTIRSGPVNLVLKKGTCYAQSLREVLQTSGYELVVRFPGRAGFFTNEAGLMLISSVILILLIIVSIFQLVRLYRNELRLSENIRELINNVTHEFRTPMSSIALASNLIRKGRDSGNSDKIREYGDLIYRENQKLQRQVDSLLDLAAVEWEEFEYIRKPERMKELAEDALQSVKMMVEECHAVVTTDFSENDTVNADRVHITNALVNLLTNALKYSPGRPEIQIVTRVTGKLVFTMISDKGTGIPRRYQKYIFDKYFRVPTGDVHNIKGFGIGLSYVKSVVEAHGGRVNVASDPGKGSTFTLIMPKFNKNED